MTELECVSCGIVISSKPTGRPPKYCEECFKKYRVEYQRRQWQKLRPTVHKRVPAMVPNLLTVRSDYIIKNQASLNRLRYELWRHKNSRQSRAERNGGGSGYMAIMPSNIDHSMYQCRLKLAKSRKTMLKFRLDFTRSTQKLLTERINGTDQWCWYLYEFNRQLRERREKGVSVE